MLFFLFIVILPFYGANNFFGNVTKEKNTVISQNKINKNNKFKFSDNNLNAFLLEENDSDSDELFHCNTNNSDKNNFLDYSNYFIKKWQDSILKIFTTHYNSNSTIYSHFSGFSNPIYISIQVLRI